MNKIDFPSERFIEDYVMECLVNDGECPLTGDRSDMAYSQVRLGVYGVADIVKIETDNEVMKVTILELKNQPLKLKDLAQLGRYMKGVEQVVERYTRRIKNCIEIEVFGELVGPTTADSHELDYISGVLKNISIYSIELTMENGFTSKHINQNWRYSKPNIKLQPIVRQVYDAVYDTVQMFKDYDAANKAVVVNINNKNGGI